MSKASKTPATTLRLKLSEIIADDALQPRKCGLDGVTLEEYVEAIRGGAEFPPLVVYVDVGTGTYWLSEGFHRYAAAKKVGLKKFPCEVRKGTRADAMDNACGSNDKHGLRRTNDDKRHAVAKLIAAHPDWSNRKIARAARVSHTFVNDIRPEAGKGGNVSTRPNPEPTLKQPDDEEEPHDAGDDAEPEPDELADEVTEDELPAASAPVPSERERLAHDLEPFILRLEAFANTPDGKDLFAVKVDAGPLMRDVAAMIGAALETAKPDHGPMFAADRKTTQDVRHAERVDPSERLKVPQCVVLHQLFRVLRGAKS